MNRVFFVMIFATTLLSGCGGGGTNSSGTGVSSPKVTDTGMHASVSVAVTGLTNSGLVLQNNLLGNLTVTSNGTFKFANTVQSGSPYAVTILTQPTGQICSVTNGSGTVNNADISDVTVICSGGGTTIAATYSVGGSVLGLSASGLVLQNNAGDNLTVLTSGIFAFSVRSSSGASYSISILSQPVGQTCIVANGAGIVGSANVSNVAITCVGGSGKTTNIILGGTAAGLSSTGLKLSVIYGAFGYTQTSNFYSNGTFVYLTSLNTGDSYSVSVATQPVGQVCSVSNGTGTAGNSDILNLSVSCTGGSGSLLPTYYGYYFAVNGLTANGLVVNLNGSLYTIPSNVIGQHSGFPQSNYSITIQTQPTGQTCSVLNGVGVATSTSPAVNIEINCI